MTIPCAAYDQFGRLMTSPPFEVTAASTQHTSARRSAQSSAETPMGAVGLSWMVRPVANANNLPCSSRVIHDWQKFSRKLASPECGRQTIFGSGSRVAPCEGASLTA